MQMIGEKNPSVARLTRLRDLLPRRERIRRSRNALNLVSKSHKAYPSSFLNLMHVNE